MAVFRRLKKTFIFDPKRRFTRYVAKVAEHKAWEKTSVGLRKTRPPEAGSKTITEVPDPRPSPSSHLKNRQRQEARDKLRQLALAITKEHVSNRDYQIFLMRFIQEEPKQKVVVTLNCSSKAVDEGKCRGLKAYNEILNLLKDTAQKWVE